MPDLEARLAKLAEMEAAARHALDLADAWEEDLVAAKLDECLHCIAGRVKKLTA